MHMPPDSSGPRLSLLDGDTDVWVLSVPLAEGHLASLTPAERGVAALAVAGASNLAIAAARGSSSRTVANQLAAIYRKLGIASRAELAATLGNPCG